MENHDTSRTPRLKGRRVTILLAGLTLIVLALSAPASLRDAFDRGGFYLFSLDFLKEIPQRLTGPGRFRFFMQPLIAIILGIGSGRADAKAGRPPFIYGLIFHPELRGEMMKSAYRTVANLVLMGILLDSLFQWILFGVSHPGAALVVGPVLILLPYMIARAFANRFTRLRKRERPLSSS